MADSDAGSERNVENAGNVPLDAETKAELGSAWEEFAGERKGDHANFLKQWWEILRSPAQAMDRKAVDGWLSPFKFAMVAVLLPAILSQCTVLLVCDAIWPPRDNAQVIRKMREEARHALEVAQKVEVELKGPDIARDDPNVGLLKNQVSQLKEQSKQLSDLARFVELQPKFYVVGSAIVDWPLIPMGLVIAATLFDRWMRRGAIKIEPGVDLQRVFLYCFPAASLWANVLVQFVVDFERVIGERRIAGFNEGEHAWLAFTIVKLIIGLLSMLNGIQVAYTVSKALRLNLRWTSMTVLTVKIGICTFAILVVQAVGLICLESLWKESIRSGVLDPYSNMLMEVKE